MPVLFLNLNNSTISEVSTFGMPAGLGREAESDASGAFLRTLPNVAQQKPSSIRADCQNLLCQTSLPNILPASSCCTCCVKAEKD